MIERNSRRPARFDGPRGIAALFSQLPDAQEARAPVETSTSDPKGNEPGGKPGLGDAVHFALNLMGVVVSTQLIVWGVFFLMFLLLGDASIDGMMRQLANLSTRYVAAGLERQMQFKWLFAGADIMMCVFVILLRHRSLLPAPRVTSAGQ
ncbi:MAG: hypothetical protein JHC57_07845 [Sphingopyxis sp.]|uniref:hypothetical protein n=1 Tax=Sphingopyxis sp. TaxID=1908224 RepID=UPI001A1F2E1E|nr:hypothetical protein [Sphingopyxis sp.]MBJ7499648.1 hypothetical protein [Sphingopyxis sp.]